MFPWPWLLPLVIILLSSCATTEYKQPPAGPPYPVCGTPGLPRQGGEEAAPGDGGSNVDDSGVFGAEEVMRALEAAYPGQITQVAYGDGDWSMLVQGERCFYAQGRLLPEDLRDRYADYAPYEFYLYPRALPPWKPPGPAEVERLRKETEALGSSRLERCMWFLDTLYQSHDEEEAERRLALLSFLGKRIPLHYRILEETFLVDQKIREAASREGGEGERVRSWIEGLSLTRNPEFSIIVSFKYRFIKNTKTKSYHAYGAAIDLLPADGKAEHSSYWAWVAEKRQDWWNIPYGERSHPPEEVIRAFEDSGFIWGGKWGVYDSCHFEYRPEILILNGIGVWD